MNAMEPKIALRAITNIVAATNGKRVKEWFLRRLRVPLVYAPSFPGLLKKTRRHLIIELSTYGFFPQQPPFQYKLKLLKTRLKSCSHNMRKVQTSPQVSMQKVHNFQVNQRGS
jgi:hypothetical protein